MQITTAPNFRDFGGQVTANGGRVRRGLLYRSEAVTMPDDADVARLNEIGIALVCDLRGASERDHLPNLWWAKSGTECFELDLLGGIFDASGFWAALQKNPTEASAKELMLGIYRELPQASAQHLRRIFGRLAAGDLPILIHCTAGKDRTGFICAMILFALGVDEQAVMADYLATKNRMSARVRAATARFASENLGHPVPVPVLNALIGVAPEFLDASLHAISERVGSIDAYLEIEAGLSPVNRRSLHDRLVASSTPHYYPVALIS